MKHITNPVYDPNATPVYDTIQIKTKLQHRYPFLLVDKIMAVDETSIFGIKNVTANEPFFQGHFPDQPIMPGVLLIEALGQCGGILVLNSVEDAEKYSTYFVKIDGFKFKRMVVPGDTLKLQLEFAGPIRRNMVTMNGRVFVGDHLVAEGHLVAQVIKDRD